VKMIKTICWHNGKVRIIDQTQLPNKLVYLNLRSLKEVGEAIRSLRIRGAPAIGLAAALGVVLEMNQSSAKTILKFREELRKGN